MTPAFDITVHCRVEVLLNEHGLFFFYRFRESNVHDVSLSPFLPEPSDSFRFRGPKLPCEHEALMGVKRLRSNPDKIAKVFGSNSIITTSIGPQWELKCL
jgi:hypothetical protein